jgi:hypothetical protein
MVRLEEWLGSTGNRVVMLASAKNANDENAHDGKRCFVVVREGLSSVVCCALQTLPPEDAARLQPLPMKWALRIVSVSQTESMRNGEPSRVDGFPIILENTSVSLDSELKLDFAKPCTVEHSSKVLNIGRIDRDYLKLFVVGFSKAMGFSYAKIEDTERLLGDDNDVEREMQGMAESSTIELNLSQSLSNPSIAAEIPDIKRAALHKGKNDSPKICAYIDV